MIFISYSRKDLAFTELIVHYFRSAGFSKEQIFYDKNLTSARFTEQLAQKIKECDDFIIILSPNSAGSNWVEDELIAARGGKKKIHVLVVSEVEPDAIPITLGAYNRFALYDGYALDKLDELVESSLKTVPAKKKTSDAVSTDNTVPEITKQQELLYKYLLKIITTKTKLDTRTLVIIFQALRVKESGYALSRSQAQSLIDTITNNKPE